MERTVKEKKIQKKYEEEFKRQAVELVIHSGKTQAQIGRELGVSGYSLNLLPGIACFTWTYSFLMGATVGP
jgi:hypothetical protein